MPPTTASTPAAKGNARIDDYEAQDAARTLTRAHEITANPALHKAASRHAKKQMRGLSKVAGMKPIAPSRR